MLLSQATNPPSMYLLCAKLAGTPNFSRFPVPWNQILSCQGISKRERPVTPEKLCTTLWWGTKL